MGVATKSPFTHMPSTNRRLMEEVTAEGCWLQIENCSEASVLVRKYRRLDFLSEQRVFLPEERGLVTHGSAWDRPFRAKIHTIQGKMKTKLLLKLQVNRMYRVLITDDGCTCTSLRIDDVDKQLCAYERMEEVWDNSNYYETLRVPQDATAREIRVAYLKLAKVYHPDHNTHPHAALMFERIAEAYHTLSDEEIRRRYDTHLRTDPGILSKSYWRQIFFHWNRHKAAQVGLSTILCIAGGAILLSSVLAAPTGVGLPAAMATGAVGGGIFAAGIGGLSIAMSRQAAIDGNHCYKRWLKYSLCYGVAGAVTGCISGGIAGLLGPAVGGGMAAVVVSGTVNGAIQGFNFGIGGGIASGRWLQLIKRLRVDAIALELAISTLTGAATGAVFQSLLMTTAGAPSMVMGHAKFSAEQILTLHGGHVKEEKTHPRRALKRDRSNSDPLPLVFPGEEQHNKQEEEDQPILLLEYTPISESAEATESSAPEDDDTVDMERIPSPLPVEEDSLGYSIVDVNEDNNPLLSDTEVLIEDVPSSEVSEETESSSTATKEEGNSETSCSATSAPQMIPLLPPDIDEFLKCEENTVESINEAISLYEAVAHAMPGQFFQFYNHARATKVRMRVHYAMASTEDDHTTDGLHIVNDYVPPREMYYLPAEAHFIQVDFEYSSMGLLGGWKSILNDERDETHVFAYSLPTTRRFFVVGFGDEIHISQVRDEYEQLVQE